MIKPLNGGPTGFTDTELEDTVELELSAEEVLELSRAGRLSQPYPVPVRSAEESLPNVPILIQAQARLGDTHSKGQRTGRVAVVLSISAFWLVLDVIAYLATTRARPIQVAAATVPVRAAPETLASPPADHTPVRFTNPFDVTEVFQFPSGTSQTEARDAVAELLLQRARARQNPSLQLTSTEVANCSNQAAAC
jgi:hypothetical protein